MSFQPVVPTGGLAGYRLVRETLERQLALFGQRPDIGRDIAAFESRAAGIASVDELMADTQVLRVVLGAYGLEEDLPRRAFVRKVIEEGTLGEGAFATRLANPAYRRMAEDVGLGNLGSRLGLDSVRAEIVERYRMRAFETAVGETSLDIRLALNFRREIAEIASAEGSSAAAWFRVIGSQPLRRVVETALGLPAQFARIDIDQQAAELGRRVGNLYGEGVPAVFRDPDVVEDFVKRFLLISQARGGGGAEASPASTASQILSAGGIGPQAQAGLVLSSLVLR